MQVIGFHQARRPRLTPAERARKALAWPRPGGIAVSVIGAALIFGGALGMRPVAEPEPPVAAADISAPSTTTDVSAATSPSFAVPTLSSAPSPSAPHSTLAASGADASPIPAPTPKPKAKATPTPRPEIDNPDSPLVVVNKRRPLNPANYAPSDLVAPAVPSGSGEPALLRAEAAAATEKLFAAAAAEGVAITIKSSYRSYDVQTSLYNGYVSDKGQAAADSTSARPGFSEHQTGLALDIGDANAGTACDFNSCFEETAAAKWVAAHGADYGFIVRYVPGAEKITGYLAEPWHLRYVGITTAQDMQKTRAICFEDFMKLPGAPDYKK